MKCLSRWIPLVSATPVFYSLQASPQQSHQISARHVPQAVSTGAAKLVRPLPSTQRLNLSIVLPLRNQDQLTNLLKQIYDPSSPNYRHFLSVDQFTEQFGPTAADYQNVVDFASSNGLEVHTAAANRMTVSFTGSVAQVEKAFGIKMRRHQHPTENRDLFPGSRAVGSSQFEGPYSVGLNNFSIPRPLLTKAASSAQPLNNSGLSSSIDVALYRRSCSAGLGPSALHRGASEFGHA